MRRSLKNLIVFAMAFVLMLAMSITAFAAGETTPVKTIRIVNEGTTQKVAAATLYVNGDVDGIDDVYLGVNGKSATPVTMTYDLAITGKKKDATIVKNLSVATKNRGVATAQLKSVDGKDKLVVTAKGTGKTTITVTDAGSKKSAKITVTVKKLVESINTGVTKEVDELTKEEYVHLEQTGKVNLQALANADASNKKLKYVVMSNKVLKDGSWEESVTIKKGKEKTVPVVKVDAKGNVTANAEKRTDIEMAKAVVRVYALDQKAINEKNKAVASGIYEDVTVYVYPATYEKTDIIQFTNLGVTTNKKQKLGKTNTYAAQTLYTNAADVAHTLKVSASAYKKGEAGYTVATSQKVVYTTSNAKVATVSADGVVTAVGNGKAIISAVPAYGFTTPKATVNVTVKTKPEAINVPADVLTIAEGKTVKLNASIAKNASYKKLTYSIEEGAEFVKLNAKKGTVQGLASGTAMIKVSTVEDKKGEYPVISRMVTVNVQTPVNKITLTDMEGNAIPKTITLYAYDASALTTEAPTSYTFKANVTGKKNADGTFKTPTNINVTPVSNKPAVADCGMDGDEVFSVNAWKKGSANITVTADDGSKKKATAKVNVVQLVDEINVANAYEEWVQNPDTGNWDEKVLHLNVVKGQKTTIKATANADANNKKLNTPTIVSGATTEEIGLNKWNVTLPETMENGATVELEIKAKDGVKINDNVTTEPFSQKLILHAVDKMTYADNVWINAYEWQTDEFGMPSAVYAEDEDWNVTAITMKKGSTFTLKANFAGDVVDRTTKWSVANKNKAITVKDGVVTAKAVTDEAVVVLTYKTGAGKKDVATKEVRVRVIPSDADYQKALNKNIKATLKAEDRTYLGAKVNFAEKTSSFNVQITNPYAVIADLKDTGITDVFTSLVDADTKVIEVANWVKDNFYTFERVSAFDINIIKNGSIVATASGISDLTAFLKAELEAEGYTTFADLNGINADVAVWSVAEAEDGFLELPNHTMYSVNFSIADADVEAIIDARIENELKNLNESGILTQAGVASVDYNAALNVATVNIKDGKVTVEEAEAIKVEVADALKKIFAEVTEANVNAQVTDFVNVGHTFVKNEDGDLDAAIENLFAKIKEQAGATTEIGQFEGGRVDARATFVYGMGDSYSFDYVVNFVRTVAAVDAQVDERIANEIANIDTKDSGLMAEYDAETNALTVKVDKTDYSVLTLQNTGLFVAIENTLKDVAKANAEVSAVVATSEKETVIEDLANVSKAQLEEAFGLADDITLVDLLDDSAVITVVYPQITNDVTLTYTVAYELNMDLIDVVMSNVIVNALTDAKAADDVIAEATYADHTISVTFDAGKDKEIAKTGVLYSVFKSAIPVDVDGISAVGATFAGNNYQKAFGVDAINELVMEEILNGTVGVSADSMVSELDNTTMTIKVDYDKNGVDCAIVYTIEFAVINSPVDPVLSDESEGDDSVSENDTEETTEEASEEETTEETSEEETTEETSEEESTEEEVTEDATEESVEETEEEIVEEDIETTEETSEEEATIACLE